jgi:prophage DNA circulation protein
MTAQDTAGLVAGLRRIATFCFGGTSDANAAAVSRAADALESMGRELEHLSDPIAVHINMMRGTIAKPSIENIHHLYPEIREEAAKTRLALSESQAEGRRLREALRQVQFAQQTNHGCMATILEDISNIANTALAARDEGDGHG